MRILFLLQSYPFPPTDGNDLKAAGLIRRLSEWHECLILSFDQRGEVERAPTDPGELIDLYPVSEGPALQAKRVLKLLRGHPPSLARWSNGGFHDAIESIVDRCGPDVIHFDLVNMLQYGEAACEIPSIASVTDLTSRRYARKASLTTGLSSWRYAGLSRLLRRFERCALPDFDRIHVVSSDEGDQVENIAPDVPISVIPPMVEEEYLEPPEPANRRSDRIFAPLPLAVPGNVQAVEKFLEDGLPLLREGHPDAHVELVGRPIPDSLRRSLTARKGVEYTHWVEDFRGSLDQAAIVLLLDRMGTGIKNRTLQSFFRGKPTVATATALQGISGGSGRHYIEVTSEKKASEACVHLLSNPERAAKIGRNARDLAMDNFHPRALTKRWEDCYSSAIKQG